MNLPYSTGIKADWHVVKDGNKFYAKGTALHETMIVKQPSKEAAERYVSKRNADAREAIEGNAKYLAERKQRAEKLREERSKRQPAQLRFI